MRRALVVAVLLSLPFGAAGLTVAVRFAWDRLVAGAPLLLYADTVDLGERERGEIAVGRLRVTNGGSGKLILKDFRTSCSCAGVEREESGKYVPIQSVQLAPGEQVELTARVAIGARPGERQWVQVHFNTNDPARPTVTIDLIAPRVKGGIFSQPAAVVFGTVPVRGRARSVIDLYDNGNPDRRVEHVRSTHPDRFEVRLLPLQEGETHKRHETAGGLIARLEVVARTDRPGSLLGNIEVHLAGEARRPDLISVAGQVVSSVECWPSSLVLPRRVGDRLLYSGDVLLRQRDGGRIERADLGPVPDGVTAAVRPVLGREDQRWLHVECRPEEGAARRRPAPPVRVTVYSGGEEAVVEVPLLITEAPR